MNLSQFNRILVQILLLPVIALGLGATILVLQIHSAHNTVARIRSSDDSIAAAVRTENLIIDEETSLRGFQITGDPQFLEPYRASAAPLQQTLQILDHNLRASGESAAPVDAIRSAITTWQVGFAEPIMAATSTGAETSGSALNQQGKRQMDAIRARIVDLLDREDKLRTEQVTRWQFQSRHTIEALVVLAMLAGLLISTFTVTQLHRVSDAFQGTLDGLRRHSQSTFESEERLRTTLTSIGDGVIVCDPTGLVELVNTVAQGLTGWSQQDAYHRPLEEVFHIINEVSRERVENPVDKVKRLNRVVGLANHTILIRRDGSELHIDDSGAPIHNRAGALSGIVLVFRDITEQRQTQNALLATEKLAVAGRLAATIAHEIHNPLDSVVNLLYLIREEKDTAVSSQYLQMAEAELSRMGQISRAMLGLYRESKMPVPVNVKEMLESILVLLDRQFKQARIELSTHLPDGLQIEGFPAELRQVFTNLISNSIEATPSGGHISLSARAAPASAKGSGETRSGVIIDIADNGSGIAAEALGHIFEPFFTTKGERGTGLGLWVSHGIVSKHGGTIHVTSKTSESAHGTTIAVFLPRVSAAKTHSAA